ncbi:MAG: hypothetical protein Nkreftii_001682 [Candidatus Nitrospira kreftii]|uniref:Uncharacterized protein n=1 Tax=Candidatus Nitrospira kreftii TaxID=2652173 RepID=A0A7S8FDL6_9BACT|nr:MAG: hypothetical protein Nkreftii_001682 [Candidatus Nitrospira kreftii]
MALECSQVISRVPEAELEPVILFGLILDQSQQELSAKMSMVTTYLVLAMPHVAAIALNAAIFLVRNAASLVKPFGDSRVPAVLSVLAPVLAAAINVSCIDR